MQSQTPNPASDFHFHSRSPSVVRPASQGVALSSKCLLNASALKWFGVFGVSFSSSPSREDMNIPLNNRDLRRHTSLSSLLCNKPSLSAISLCVSCQVIVGIVHGRYCSVLHSRYLCKTPRRLTQSQHPKPKILNTTFSMVQSEPSPPPPPRPPKVIHDMLLGVLARLGHDDVLIRSQLMDLPHLRI